MIPEHDFIKAGKAIFTLSRGDQHYTYRVDKVPERYNPALNVHFVKVAKGYDDYVYAGILTDKGVKYTKASKLKDDSPSMRMLNEYWCDTDFVEHQNSNGVKDVIQFRHEGRCCVCARTLTNPESIDAGIGPECAGKLGS